MQLPPIQIPPSQYPRPEAEPPLPRLKWVWVVFTIFFTLLIVSSLWANDQKKPALLQDTKKMEEKSIDIQLRMKSLRTLVPDPSNTKVPMFEPQIEGLLEKARKDPEAQKLRIVLRKEDGEKPFLDDVRNLAKSSNKENQAFAKLYGEKKPTKEEATALLKQIDGNELSERLAEVQTKESFGDKKIREAKFDPSGVTGLAIISVLYIFGLGLGTAVWIYYYVQRQAGRLAPLGLPMANIDWGRADRLLFVSLLMITAYFLAGAGMTELVRMGGPRIELLVYAPIFVVMVVCMKVPIFGWHITPEKMGLSFKDFPKQVAWAVGAFFANIPILTALVAIASVLLRFLPGGSHPISEEILNNPSSTELLKIFFLASVVAPIWEEFFFRGLLFPAFNKAFGKPLHAALLSSFIFAAIHPQGAAGVAVLMGIALMLCAVTYQTKSLVANMILHGLHNGAILAFVILFSPILR